jgi:hypothetical protein
MSTRYGPLVKTIRVLNNIGNPSKVDSLRNDFLRAIDPYIVDNGIRLGYLLTLAIK